MSDNAFPIEQSSIGSGYDGLTKRELIAAMAMQAILSSIGDNVQTDVIEVVKESIKQADALLTELSKTP